MTVDMPTRQALVVDDNLVNRLLAVRMLERLGWSVTESEDGESALSFLAQHSCALVLLDLSMPGVSGESVCQDIRHHDDTTRIVAYTAHAHPEEIRRLTAIGFDGLLVKPVTLDRLVEALTQLGLYPLSGAAA